MTEIQTNQMVPEIETVQDIVAKYHGRSLYDPRNGRKNYRAEHLDKYETMETTPTVHVHQEEAPKIISSDDFRNRLKESFLLYKKMQHIQSLYFHPVNIEMIREICNWVTGEEGMLSPMKGLYIYGQHGSGKTDFTLNLTNTCKVLSRKFDNVQKYHPYAYNAIYESLRSGADFNTALRIQENVYLDDFLYQDRNTAKIFGNQDNVADMVVTRLYDLHKCGYRHIITSNMPPDQIDMHPGSIDRMNEMFNFIFWEGKSLRG